MKAFLFVVSACFLSLTQAMTAEATTVRGGESIAIQEMTLTLPDGWVLRQDAKDQGTIILGFEKADEYLTVFVKQKTGLDMRSIFANGSRTVRDVRSMTSNGYDWKILETSKEFSARRLTYFVASFLTELNGFSYYGYSATPSSQRSFEIVNEFLQAMR